jgi:succinoglycan biosynthesis protein ExoM
MSAAAETTKAIPPDVSVCIATFRRPQKLARLLESLRHLTGIEHVRLEVVLVDNDAAETARPVYAALCSEYPYPIRYFVEPQQSLARVRNRTVQEARGLWVAMIDDDEVAADHWLAAYWSMRTQYPGDGYFGPVLPRFEHTAPAWLDTRIYALFLGPAHQPHGMPMPANQLRSGNAFLRRELFATHAFDTQFGLTGGEDLELFLRMLDAGAGFYWCNDAVTYEYYPPERVCLRWLVHRAFHSGSLYTRIDKIRHPQVVLQGFNVAKAAGGLCLFALMLPVELLRGRPYVLKRFLRLSVQAGHLWEFCRPS